MDKSNKKKVNVDVLMSTRYHWAMFFLPSMISLLCLFYSIKQHEIIYFFGFLFISSIIFAIYKFNFSNKKFILISTKMYFMDKKEKKVTINLSQCELIDYSYESSIFSKILGYNHIQLLVLRNNQKYVLNYYFVKNGKEFILRTFLQSEKFLLKENPNYVPRVNKDMLLNLNTKKANIDKVE